MSENERYAAAKRKIEAIKSFYSHLVIYVVVNAGLMAYNLVATPDNLWFFFPLIAWGVGLLVHGGNVYLLDKTFLKKWEEKKVKQIMKQSE